jgi:hypothetical protein
MLLCNAFPLQQKDVGNAVSQHKLLSAYQEKIPARNVIYAHAQDFSAADVLLQAILKAFIPQPLNKQQTKVFHVF